MKPFQRVLRGPMKTVKDRSQKSGENRFNDVFVGRITLRVQIKIFGPFMV